MKYRISGGDNGTRGPVFGPVVTEEVGEVTFLPDARYLLLRVLDSMVHKGVQVQFLVVSPRNQGDTMEILRKQGCTVGIGRVLLHQPSLKLTRNDVEYFAIGECEPVAA